MKISEQEWKRGESLSGWHTIETDAPYDSHIRVWNIETADAIAKLPEIVRQLKANNAALKTLKLDALGVGCDDANEGINWYIRDELIANNERVLERLGEKP